jgi:CysZ protein
MSSILGSLFFAFVNLFHPRILWLMAWPMLLSLFVWGIAALVLWGRTAAWLTAQLQRWAESGVFFFRFDGGDFLLFIAHILMALLLVPAVFLTALIILSIFGMQEMVEHVAARRFPQLARRPTSSLAGSLWNGVVALAGFAGLALLSVPLWLVPPLWPLIPVAIVGWLNQRVLRHDALAEHATGDEMRQIFRARRRTLYLMGALLALLSYVPVLNLILPVLFGLAFIHFLLGELQALRQAPIEGEVVSVQERLVN